MKRDIADYKPGVNLWCRVKVSDAEKIKYIAAKLNIKTTKVVKMLVQIGLEEYEKIKST